jgi:hypothetical protein
MKRMRQDQIPQFVADVVALGCEICAVGHCYYVLGDGDLPLEQYDAVCDDLARLTVTYGCRSHLLVEINAYLRSIGRYVEFDDPIPFMRRH